MWRGHGPPSQTWRTRTLLLHVLNDLRFEGRERHFPHHVCGGRVRMTSDNEWPHVWGRGRHPPVTDVTDAYLWTQVINDLTFMGKDRHPPVTDVTDAHLWPQIINDVRFEGETAVPSPQRHDECVPMPLDNQWPHSRLGERRHPTPHPPPQTWRTFTQWPRVLNDLMCVGGVINPLPLPQTWQTL
jgi:hypothetical protein